MFSHIHCGTGFEIWTSQQSWFWRLSDPHRNRGSVGAAATEAEAMRDARLAIEENSPCQPDGPVRCATMLGPGPIAWDSTLAKLACYLNVVAGTQA